MTRQTTAPLSAATVEPASRSVPASIRSVLLGTVNATPHGCAGVMARPNEGVVRLGIGHTAMATLTADDAVELAQLLLKAARVAISAQVTA